MIRFLVSLVLLAVLIPFAVAPAAARSLGTHGDPPPGWVVVQDIPADDGVDPATLLGGFHYLLIDRQVNIPAQQSFLHLAYRVTNSDGVQNMSDVSIEYDPSFQSLLIHSVRIHRDGRVIDNLSDHEIQVFQREPGMERHLYDGTETAVIHQRNVRAGDVIEYAYTLTGFNPIHEGRYFGRQYFQFALPIHRLFLRIVSDRKAPLYLTPLNGAPEAVRTESDAGVEHVWLVSEAPAIGLDDNIPPWFDPMPSVWISSLESWPQVIDWALPHYRIDPADAAALRAAGPQIAPAEDPETQILQTIRFVQDEIRYLGMEQGLGAYRPNQPLGVFERRFGDCKDKSLLLTALLRNLGLQAHPVLVSTLPRGQVLDTAATPLAFDHCIVGFRHDGQDFFVDPTLSHQGGNLASFGGLDYGQGLVLREGDRDLTPISRTPVRRIDIDYRFTLDEIGGPALLDVTTTYTGRSADLERDFWLNMSTEEIGRMNLDYYSFAYPGISSVSPPAIREDRRDGENILVVEEEYRIDDFWYLAETDSSLQLAEIAPRELLELVEVPASADRTCPYYLGLPIEMNLSIELKMPEDWPVEDSEVKIAGEAFDYRSTVAGQGDEIRVTFHYKRLKDSVPAAEAPRLIADHDRIWDDLFFYVSYDPGREDFQLSGFAVALMLAALLLGLAGARRLHLGYDPATPGEAWTPLSLGGVLILLLLGLVLRMGFQAYYLITLYLDHNAWTAVFSLDGFSSFSTLGTLMTGELVFNTLNLVFLILLSIQLVQRRSSFPRLMIIQMVAFPVFLVLDAVLAGLFIDIPSLQAEGTSEYADIAGSFIWAAIWIPYLVKGRRPRHTFIRRRVDRSEPEAAVQPEPDARVLDTVEPVAPEPGPAEPAVPAKTANPYNIRRVRWPVSLVLAAVLQLLGMTGFLVSSLVNMAQEDTAAVDPAQLAGYWMGKVFGLLFMMAMPLIGAVSIFTRRSWGRVYNAILLTCVGLFFPAVGWLQYTGAFEAGQSRTGDPAETLLGTSVIGVFILALALILFFSRAARTFPAPHMSYRGSGPRDGTDDAHRGGSSPAGGGACEDAVHALFRKIQTDFPAVGMEVFSQGPGGTRPALIIPEQPAVSRRILMDLQDGDILNLSIGPAWLTWEPCDRSVVRDEFLQTVAGLLAGTYRFREFRKGPDLVLARVERPLGDTWETAHEWSRDGGNGTRGLVEEILTFGTRS